MEFGIAIQNNREGASAEGMDVPAEVANRFGWTRKPRRRDGEIACRSAAVIVARMPECAVSE